MTKPTINNDEREILADVLAPFANRIESVGVFGSRATGRARKNSDIDLVVYGAVDAEDERRLWTLFEDSNLSVSVDIVAYAALDNVALKAHIDAVSVVLFDSDEVLSWRKQLPS